MIDIKKFKNIIDLVNTFSSEEKCLEHLETCRWNGIVISPFYPEAKVYKCKNNKYRCSKTGRYFTAKIGTIFEDTKVPLQKWFMAIYLVCSHKKGVSSYSIAKDIEVTQKTAWFMLQRIRKAFDVDEFQRELEGEVSADETFVGGKNKNRHVNKKVKNSGGRSFIDKTPVLGLLEKDGLLRARTLKSTVTYDLQPAVLEMVKKSSTLITDEWCGYGGLEEYYTRVQVNHNEYQYSKNGHSSNGVENFWSHLKRGLIGIYHKVSKKHLQLYLNEFVYRWNTRSLTESDRFNHLLSNINKRLTYKQLISNAQTV